MSAGRHRAGCESHAAAARRPARAAAWCALAAAAGAPQGTAAAAEPARSPYDAVRAAYAPYMNDADPFGWPLKSGAVAGGAYKFWRGTRPLYYAWAKAACADWVGDRDAYVVAHGDAHFGNVGVYPAAGRPLADPAVAFGLVDFDESARLPFQLDLLSAYVTARLTAQQNQFLLTADDRAALSALVVDTYAAAVGSDAPATQQLADEPAARALLGRKRKAYAKEVAKFTRDGRFRPALFNDDGQPTELLRPVPPELADALAAGVAAAIDRAAPASRQMFGDASPAAVRARVRDVALRTRVGSSGSQGLEKYLVLLGGPADGSGEDVIVYLKRQVPAAAERAGLVAADPRPAGERCAADMAAALRPPPLLSSWCDAAGQSFWVTLKEPWSDELDPADATDLPLLRGYTRALTTALASAHGRTAAASPEALRARATPALAAALRDRGDALTAEVQLQWAEFARDPRTAADRRAAATAVADFVRR